MHGPSSMAPAVFAYVRKSCGVSRSGRESDRAAPLPAMLPNRWQDQATAVLALHWERVQPLSPGERHPFHPYQLRESLRQLGSKLIANPIWIPPCNAVVHNSGCDRQRFHSHPLREHTCGIRLATSLWIFATQNSAGRTIEQHLHPPQFRCSRNQTTWCLQLPSSRRGQVVCRGPTSELRGR